MSNKTLAELAEEYHAEALRLKDKIQELRKNNYSPNPAAENRTLAIYEDMYRDCMRTYYDLRNYYNGDQRDKHKRA